MKYIGKPWPVCDAIGKATGETIYADDLYFPNMLYGKILTSPVAHARIKSIDTTEAEKVPGVRAIVSFMDSPPVLYNRNMNWIKDNKPAQELVFDKTVRYVGDRVAAVAADTEEIAVKALRLIKVEYEELPAVFDAEEALKNAAYQLYPDGNLLKELVKVCGNVDLAFQESDFIIENSATTAMVHHGAIEPHICIASWSRTGEIHLWEPQRAPFRTQLMLSKVFEVPCNKIHIHGTTMGGSFGCKEGLMIEPIAVLLAKKTGKPVKIRFDRKESMVSTFTRHGVKVRGKIGVDKEGYIKALDLTAIINAGPYCGDTTNVQGNMANKIFKLYKIPNMRFIGQSVLTNTPLGGAMRGYGSPAVFFGLELLIDKAARELKIDPVEFRIKNLVDPFDPDPVDHTSLGNARIKDCLLKGSELFNWREKKARRKKLETERFLYGYGVATSVHGNGVAPFSPDITVVSLELNEDGSMLLRTGLSDHGAGTYTVLKQIVAEILDMPMEKITVIGAETYYGLYDRGAGSSRNTWVGGAAVVEVAKKMRSTMLKLAAEALNSTPEDIILEDEIFKTKNREKQIDKQGVACFAYEVKKMKLVENLSYNSPKNAGSYGAHFAEAKVDKWTGEIKVEEYVAVCDVGRALNPLLLEGQIEGAILMGIGMALFEELKLDEMGRVKNPNFKKYRLPKAKDMPRITIEFIEEYEEGGPFGAKSIGEASIVPVVPAIVNAVNDALGSELTALPLTPDKVLKFLNTTGCKKEQC